MVASLSVCLSWPFMAVCVSSLFSVCLTLLRVRGVDDGSGGLLFSLLFFGSLCVLVCLLCATVRMSN
jgi:hypothetical protein